MSERMPVAFLPHGGGPVTHVEMGFAPGEVASLAKYWRSVRALTPSLPKAVLAISAHWEQPLPTVMTSPHPPMLYDYGGFPPEAYELKWPAPGSRALATRVRELLDGAGFKTAEDAERGFDHGTFTPLMQTYPDGEVPVIQLSLKQGLDPQEHLAIGRALAPLRDDGIFIVGSGDTFHNMRGFGNPQALAQSAKFDAWLTGIVTSSPAERDAGLAKWSEGPFARFCHPREEHLMPLMVVAGASGSDTGAVTWSGAFMGSRQTGYHFTAPAR